MGKYDNYICTKLCKRELLPGPSPAERDKLAAEGLHLSMEHVLWIDGDVIPGGYYGESTWMWPPSYPHQISLQELMKKKPDAHPMFPHDHNFPELLSWWGTDYDHPENFTPMSLFLGDEEIPMTRGFVAYIPADMKHMPTWPKVRQHASAPLTHWTSGPGGLYDREKEAEAGKREFKAEPIPPNTRKVGPFKNQKYIIQDYKKGVKRPPYMHEIDPQYMRPMAYIDETIIPGCEFGCDTLWLLPGNKSKAGMTLFDAHTVPYGTSITLTTMNYDDITDLAAEAELWIGGEKHIINKSFGSYIPPDIVFGPLIIRNIQKQMLFMMSQPVGEGIRKYSGKK